ncbi:MAG: NAD-dependent deacylase [Anaerolineales bacterium]
MTDRSYAQKLARAAGLLKSARHAIALTGAGISTPSGIPDFRSAGSGMWQRDDPMEVASLSAFRYQPERFFEWVRPLARDILEAEPNAAHRALASLEQAGLLQGVITQNIDDLHRRAGSKIICEVHGHLRQATCVNCFRRYPSARLLAEFAEHGEIPRCPECGGILKPEVVLLGEQLPYLVVQDAKALVMASDLILVAGSSLEVTPAATFPVSALNAGASLIIVNHQPTYLDPRAEVVFRQDVAQVLPDLAKEVLVDQA